MKRILSGIQPTSEMHLGNYLGAVKNWVKVQDEPGTERLYMVADLHAITVKQNPAELKESSRKIGAVLMALGIDLEKSTIFIQSAVAAHSELMWVLSTLTPMGWLERMTQFKDKAGKDAERAGTGLFLYPVLMAADILAYRTTHVPTGRDQKQHLELARDIAGAFNRHVGKDFFLLPEPFIEGIATRIMALDGSGKMSKSSENPHSRINIMDSAEAIADKFRRAKTDAHPFLPENMDGLAGRDEVANLLTIYAALADITLEKAVEAFTGKRSSDLKNGLTEVAVARLGPVRERVEKMMKDTAELDRVLSKGNEKARSISSRTVAEAKELMGLWP